LVLGGLGTGTTTSATTLAAAQVDAFGVGDITAAAGDTATLIVTGVDGTTDFDSINSAIAVTADVTSTTPMTLSAHQLDQITILDAGPGANVTLNTAWSTSDAGNHLTTLTMEAGSNVTVTDDQLASLTVTQGANSDLTVTVQDDVGRSIALPTHTGNDVVAFSVDSATNGYTTTDGTTYTGHYDAITNFDSHAANTYSDNINLTEILTNISSNNGYTGGLPTVATSGLTGSGVLGTTQGGIVFGGTSNTNEVFVMQNSTSSLTDLSAVATAIGSVTDNATGAQAIVMIGTGTGSSTTTGIYLLTDSGATGSHAISYTNLTLLGTVDHQVFSGEVILHH